MKLVGEYSLKPKYVCSLCGAQLYTDRVNGRIILRTSDGRRHYKTKCNLKRQEAGNERK